jgi:hypothetical protein
MVRQVEICPGVLVVFYEAEADGQEWVEIASNYNLTCPITPEMQRRAAGGSLAGGGGNVFMPLDKFRALVDSRAIRKILYNYYD